MGPAQPLADWRRGEWTELEEGEQAVKGKIRRWLQGEIPLAQMMEMQAENKPMNQIKNISELDVPHSRFVPGAR